MAMSIKSLKFLLEHSIDENGDTAITPLNSPVISMSSIRDKLSGRGEVDKLNLYPFGNHDMSNPEDIILSFKKMEQQNVFVTKYQYREIKNSLRDEIVFTRDYIVKPYSYSSLIDINRFVYKVKLIFTGKENDKCEAQMGGMYTSYIDTIVRYPSTHSKHTICNRKIFTDKSFECFLSDNFQIRDSLKNKTEKGNAIITGKGYNNVSRRFTLSYLLANTNQKVAHFPNYFFFMGRINHNYDFYGWSSLYEHKTDSDFIFEDRHYGICQDIIFRNKYEMNYDRARTIYDYKNLMHRSRNTVYYIG